jgi:hypothetical protein
MKNIQVIDGAKRTVTDDRNGVVSGPLSEAAGDSIRDRGAARPGVGCWAMG